MSSWSNDDKTCYETALEIIDRAARYIEAHDRGEQTFGGPKYSVASPRTAPPHHRRRSSRGCADRSRSDKRFVGTVQDDEKMLRFVNSDDAPRLAELGTSCPDHFLRTKIKPLLRRLGPGSGRHRHAEESYRRRHRSSTARTTRPTTSAASTPTRPRCATRTRPSS